MPHGSWERSGESDGLRHQIQYLILAPPLKSYINLGKILGPSVPQLFSSVKGDNNSNSLIGRRIKPSSLSQGLLAARENHLSSF